MLNIIIRGENYKIDKHGCILGGSNNVELTCKNGHQWDFLGVSKHHWKQSVDFTFKDIQKNPKLAIGGLFWDIDHGTTRQWKGRYCGKLPRITNAWND